MSVPSMMIEPLSGLSRPMRVLRKHGLAGAGGAEHHADLAGGDGQRDVAPDQLLAERLRQVLDLDLHAHGQRSPLDRSVPLARSPRVGATPTRSPTDQ